MTIKQHEILNRCYELLMRHFSDESLSEMPAERLQTQNDTMDELGKIADKLLATCRGEVEE